MTTGLQADMKERKTCFAVNTISKKLQVSRLGFLVMRKIVVSHDVCKHTLELLGVHFIICRAYVKFNMITNQPLGLVLNSV